MSEKPKSRKVRRDDYNLIQVFKPWLRGVPTELKPRVARVLEKQHQMYLKDDDIARMEMYQMAIRACSDCAMAIQHLASEFERGNKR